MGVFAEKVGEVLANNKWAGYALDALDFAAGPIKWSVGKLVMASPIGKMLNSGMEKIQELATNFIGSQAKISETSASYMATGVLSIGALVINSKFAKNFLVKMFGKSKVGKGIINNYNKFDKFDSGLGGRAISSLGTSNRSSSSHNFTPEASTTFRDSNGRLRNSNGTFAKDPNVVSNKSSFSHTTDKMRKDAQGQGYLDPLTNKFVSGAGELLSPDHIYPVKDIKGLPGFEKLTLKQQKAIIHNHSPWFR